MYSRKKWPIVAIGIGLMVVCACMKDYGRLRRDTTIGQDFKNGVVHPDLRYYYTGRENIPYAIVGVDSRFAVASNLWVGFDPDPDKLRQMSRSIFQKERQAPRGAAIVGPDGQTIGVWYSNLYNYSVRVDRQARAVRIRYANPELRDAPG